MDVFVPLHTCMHASNSAHSNYALASSGMRISPAAFRLS